jgi:hypothetical protein
MKMDNYVYAIATNARYGSLVSVVVIARNAHDRAYHVAMVIEANRDLAAHQHGIEKIFMRLGEMTTTADVLSLLKRKYTDYPASHPRKIWLPIRHRSGLSAMRPLQQRFEHRAKCLTALR